MKRPHRRWYTRFDAYGMADPDNNEGQPEDRCNVCEWPVSDHPAHGGTRAKWPHRRAAAIALLISRLDPQ